MKKILLFLAAIVMAVSSASAINAADVVARSPYAILTFKYTYAYKNNGRALYNIPEMPMVVELVATDNNTLAIKEILNTTDTSSDQYAIVTGYPSMRHMYIDLSTSTPKLLGARNVINFVVGTDMDSYGAYYITKQCPFYNISNLYNGYYYGIIPMTNTGDYHSNAERGNTITKDASGEYVIKMNGFVTAKLDYDTWDALKFDENENMIGNNIASNVRVYIMEAGAEFGCIELRTFVPNKKASHTLVIDGQNIAENYDVNIKLDANNKFTVENFANMGLPYEVLDNSPWTFKWNTFEGQLDLLNVGAEMPDMIVGADPFINSKYLYDTYMCGDLDKDYNINSITGTIKGDVEVSVGYRNGATHPWGGPSYKKIMNPYIEFDDIKCYDVAWFNDFQAQQHACTYKNMKLPLPVASLDITPDCKVNIVHKGYGDAGNYYPGEKALYLSGNIEILKNINDIEEYELYLIPGEGHDPVNDKTYDHTKMHAKATRIDLGDFHHHHTPEATPANAPKRAIEKDPDQIAAELNDGLNFNLLIPESKMAATDPNGKYSVYVAAKHTAASAADFGTDRTFHAMTAVGNPNTGVNDVIAGNMDAAITVNGGVITILGSNGPASIYTASGVEVYNGGDGDVTVAPGMYIVRAGKTVRKVTVK